MATTLDVKFELPVSAQQGFDAMVNVTALEQMLQATEAEASSVTVESAPGGQTLVTIDRTFREDFPSIVKKFVGETVVTHEVRAWQPSVDSDRFEAVLDVDVVGMPAKVTATIVIQGFSSHCTVAFTGKIKVDYPFIGGVVEEMARDIIEKAIRVEVDVMKDYLNG